MKITKRQLRRIIREEKAKLMEQPDIPDVMGAIGDGKFQPREEFEGSMLDLDDYEALKDMILSTVRSWSSMTGYTEEDAIHALKSIIEEI